MLWLIQWAKPPLQPHRVRAHSDAEAYVQVDGPSENSGLRKNERRMDAEKLLIGEKIAYGAILKYFNNSFHFADFSLGRREEAV